jgi:hypothetical protein
MIPYTLRLIRFEVLAAMNGKISVFQDVTPCSMLDTLSTKLHGIASQKFVRNLLTVQCVDSSRMSRKTVPDVFLHLSQGFLG